MSSLTVEGGSSPGRVLRVGDWHVDARRNEVRRGDEAVRLEPKVIEVLIYLARRAGEVVGREELLSAVWPGVVVGDDALTQAIIKLRKAFGDDAHRPKYIETISKRGYRLLAPVEESGKPAAAAMRGSFLLRHRRAVAAAAAVLLLSLGVLLTFPQVARSVRMPWPLAADPHGVPASPRPLIAVLPLANLSGDPKRDYFSDGVTEDIINALGRFSGLGVLARSAVDPFKGRSVTPRAIMDELGARYIVKGSVREADGKLRVAVELSDAEKGMLLWSERYDGEGREVFEIQDRIVKSIAGTLAVKLTQLEQQRVLSKPVDNLEAYDLVLRARSLLIVRADRGANREARALLTQALRLAPDYAQAHISMADAEMSRAVLGMRDDPEESVNAAERHAARARLLDDSNSRVHSTLANIHIIRSEFDQALQEADRAIELNSSDSMSHGRRGEALLSLGRIDEAIASYETAKRFDPGGHTGRANNFGLAYYTAGRYRDALAVADAMVVRNPDYEAIHALRAAAFAQLGNEEEAKLAAAQVRRLNPFFKVEQFGTRFKNPEHTAKIQDGLRKAGL